MAAPGCYFSVCLTTFKDRKMLFILKILILQFKIIICLCIYSVQSTVAGLMEWNKQGGGICFCGVWNHKVTGPCVGECQEKMVCF